MTCEPFIHIADQEQMDIMHFSHILLNIIDPKHKEYLNCIILK